MFCSDISILWVIYKQFLQEAKVKCLLKMDLMCNFLPGDPRLVEQIVKELKSEGIFDQFRKECISDVDTKPAYQNLRQRVEGSVSNFLKEQTWNPDMNKNQVRETLRKHIHESGFLETGVERIVDQVVNPKINTVFVPKVEDVMYKFLGIERPKETVSEPLEINTIHDLLPKDLEAVSPEAAEEKDFLKEDIDEVKMGDVSSNSDINNEKILLEENSIDSQSSGMVSHDSNNSLKQDSLMSLNSSESRISLSENALKIESEDTILSHKSTDSNSKTELLTDEKIQSENPNINNKEENVSPTEEMSEKSSEETKTKSRDSNDKKKEKYHSSSDRSKSRSDKEKDKSRSDKHKKEEKDSIKDGKTEKEKYKIPKISDKNKESKSKEKEDKYRSDKGKSEKDSKTDRDRKSDKDRKSKHSSERDSDKSKRDKNEKREKDEKRDKKDSSKGEKSKDDRRSSSSKKRDSSSSKDSHKDKDKESNTKNKDETSEKHKNGHSSSSSRKDSKSKKDEDKSKSSHKKDDKNDAEDRKRKRKSKDDHYSSKEKRSGGRSSDRDSDGPSSNKRLHVSPQVTTGDYSNQQTNQESSGLNSEGSSGYSGNSDKTEDKHEEVSQNALIEIQKIKLPKFASNYQEAMKIMKIRKLLKKLDSINQPNPSSPDVKRLLNEIKELTKDLKRDQKEHKEKEEKTEPDEESDDNQKTETSKSPPINIEDFISSSNISMAKWNALEAKFMEQITEVDYNSYESPYMDDEDTSFEQRSTKEDNETKEEFKEEDHVTLSNTYESIDASISDKILEPEKDVVSENYEEPVEDNSPEKSPVNNCGNENSNDTKQDPDIEISIHSSSDDFSKHTTEEITVDKPEHQIDDISEVENKLIPSKFKDFKQRAIVLLKKHALTEEMIKTKKEDNIEEPQIDPITEKENKTLNVLEIGKENIGVNTINDELDMPVENLESLGNSQNNYNKSMHVDKVKTRSESQETVEGAKNVQKLKGIFTKELDENNLVAEESFSQDIDIYSLQNSCKVCLDSKGDLCKGFEPSGNLRSMNIINYIINILENEISKSKENIELYKNQENEYQSRKRKVNEKKTSNNNFDDPASKRLEVEDIKKSPKNITSSKRIHPHTNSKTKSKLINKTESKNVDEKTGDNQVYKMKSRKQSTVPESSDDKTNEKSPNKATQDIDGSSEKKNRTSQRYSSEDLYKPRMFLRRSGRDFKHP